MALNEGLQGKVALVTGGARDIGQAVSLALAAAGAKVAVPHIEALVVQKLTEDKLGLPGNGFDALPDWSQMSPEEKEERHSHYLQENVYPYERWADVLDELDPENPFRSWVQSVS